MCVALKAQMHLTAFDALFLTVLDDDTLSTVHESDLVTVLVVFVQGVV